MPHDDAIDDPDLCLSDLMLRWPETIPVFLRHNMLCVGCMVGPFHTVVDACAEHDINEQVFRDELARAVTAGRPSSR